MGHIAGSAVYVCSRAAKRVTNNRLVASKGREYSYLNAKCLERILAFCRDNLRELRGEQENIERVGGMRYPLMKLADMYFWQIGFELDDSKIDAGAEPIPGL